MEEYPFWTPISTHTHFSPCLPDVPRALRSFRDPSPPSGTREGDGGVARSSVWPNVNLE